MCAATSRSTDEPPLIVDLEGTLVRGDLVLEALFVLVKRQPWLLLVIPLWLLRGRAFLEAEIERRAALPADGLLYNEALLSRLREERAAGRRLVLATSSSRRNAEAIAAHLALFDDVIASDDARPAGGEAKTGAILEHLRGGAFDYAGNDAADVPIWRKARKVICVDTSPGVLRTVRSFAEAPDEITRAPRNKLGRVIKAIRAYQWMKNLLLFVPLAAAHRVEDVDAWLHALAGFAAFSLCASSVYVLNDLTDLPSDRAHPRKRARPFAAGDLSVREGLALIPTLLAASFAIALVLLPREFLIVLAVYYACFLGYNFAAKERVVWDVIVLAMLYTLRVLAGAAAVLVPPSFWLLAFSMFIFVSLALAKRYSEMVTMQKAGKRDAAGRGYVTDDMPALQSMGVAAGFLSVLVIAMYINSPEVHALYGRPYVLWGICPLFLFWIMRVWLVTHRGQMHDDPIVFAVRDPTSVIIGALLVGCLAGAAAS